MRSLSMLLVTAAVALAAPQASAQTRDGFFVGFGLGWGTAGVDCDECLDDGDREGSLSANVRLGAALGDRLLLGAELDGWFDDSLVLFNPTAALYYYPTDSGLFVKGGIGLSRADFEFGAETVGGLGWGLMAGVGYDFPIGDRTAVTSTATFWYGSPGDLSLEGIVVLTGFKHNVFEVTVGITFY